MTKARLDLTFLDFWHCGSGSGRGASVDAVVDRDYLGLPYVPGRMLKGLLRDAVGTLEGLGHAEAGSAEHLFGRAARSDETGQTRQASVPGVLAVSDARLPDDLARWLAHEEQRAARAALTTEVFSTAIDSHTGVALDRSLRAIEVAIPLELHAEIAPVGRCQPGCDWRDIVRRALPLLNRIGAGRSRGLGRCVAELKEPQA